MSKKNIETETDVISHFDKETINAIVDILGKKSFLITRIQTASKRFIIQWQNTPKAHEVTEHRQDLRVIKKAVGKLAKLISASNKLTKNQIEQNLFFHHYLTNPEEPGKYLMWALARVELTKTDFGFSFHNINGIIKGLKLLENTDVDPSVPIKSGRRMHDALHFLAGSIYSALKSQKIKCTTSHKGSFYQIFDLVIKFHKIRNVAIRNYLVAVFKK